MLEKLPGVVGHALSNLRAGLDALAFHTLGLRAGHGTLHLSSLAFADHGPIPARYTADGVGLSPPLAWFGVPASAGSLVLLMEDADSPTPHPLVHAIALGLPPEDGALTEGALSTPAADSPHLRLGRNSLLQTAWLPPDPPPGHGAHRYAFELYALAPAARFSPTPGREELLTALDQWTLASGLLIGTYERPDGRIRIDGAAPVVAA